MYEKRKTNFSRFIVEKQILKKSFRKLILKKSFIREKLILKNYFMRKKLISFIREKLILKNYFMRKKLIVRKFFDLFWILIFQEKCIWIDFNVA